MKNIIIVGGGASGILALHELVSRMEPGSDTKITLIEKNPILGGLAYNVAAIQGVVLNTPISTMSAFVDNPSHLLEWLNSQKTIRSDWPKEYQEKDVWSGSEFCPRVLYGFYLRDIYNKTIEKAHEKGIHIELLTEEVNHLNVTTEGLCTVTLSSRKTIESNALLLCVGQLNNAELPFFKEITAHPNYVGDLWSREGLSRLEGIPITDSVLVVGTGLTANDIVFKRKQKHQDALAVDSTCEMGHTYLVSRHALMHKPYPDVYSREPFKTELAFEPIKVAILAAQGKGALAFEEIKSIKALIKAESIRLYLTGLHPEEIYRCFMRALVPHWGAFSEETRAFLYRKYKHYDVYRTGLSLEVADCVSSMEKLKKLTLLSAQVKSINWKDDQFVVRLLVKTAERDASGKRIKVEATVFAKHVINAAGFDCELRASSSPLIRDMIEKGLLAQHYLGLGFECDHNGRFIDKTRSPTHPIFGLGAITNGQTFDGELKLGSARSMAGIRRQIPKVIDAILFSLDLSKKCGVTTGTQGLGFFGASTEAKELTDRQPLPEQSQGTESSSCVDKTGP